MTTPAQTRLILATIIIDRQRRAAQASHNARAHLDRWSPWKRFGQPVSTERDLHQACCWQLDAAHEAKLARQGMGLE